LFFADSVLSYVSEDIGSELSDGNLLRISVGVSFDAELWMRFGEFK